MGEIDWTHAGRRIVVAICGAHLAGAVFVFIYLSQFAPLDPARHGSLAMDVGLFGAFALVAFPATSAWCERISWRALGWGAEDRPPTNEEREQTLAMPRRLAAVTAIPWAAASVFFGGTTALVGHTAVRSLTVFFTILDGGLISCTIGFLLLERSLRPAIALALAGAEPKRRGMIGVRL